MDAEDGTGEVSRRACISGTDGSACCLPDVLAGNVVLKGLRLINRAYREDIVISSASPIHSEGMGGVIDPKTPFSADRKARDPVNFLHFILHRSSESGPSLSVKIHFL